MSHIVCVGDLMVDVIAQLPGPLAPGSDTPAEIAFHGGGAAANVAAWLAAAGCAATFVGRAGDDVAGRSAVAELELAGVTCAVAVDATRSTGTCIVLVDPQGERTMVPSIGANASLGELDTAATLPPSADCLYVSGYALLAAGARTYARAALAVAREREWPIAVDAASAAPLAAAGAEAFADWVGDGLLVFANDDEAEVLTGTRGRRAAALLGARFGSAVVKRGEDGAVWSDGTLWHEVAAHPVRARDTTGAGDAFSAGFLAARAGGADVPACLSAAVRLAAQAVTATGARPARAGTVAG